MTTIDARRESIAFATRMNAERRRLAAAYVATLTDEELAAARAPFTSSRNKTLTGREDWNLLSANRRLSLLLLQRRIWEAAGKPGRSDAMIRWERYE